MALLIDGYNLLHVTGIFGYGGSGTVLHQSREAFLNWLAGTLDERERAQTTIVFDAAGAPPGLPRMLMHQGMTVHFARGYPDADEMIEDLIDECHAPQDLLVVSSDHRIQRAGRRRRTKLADSEGWFAERESARRQSASPAEPPGKPIFEPTAEQVEYWLREFGGQQQASGKGRGAKNEDVADPFPPGYGDDLLEGEE